VTITKKELASTFTIAAASYALTPARCHTP
jgi:hypothetical protein